MTLMTMLIDDGGSAAADNSCGDSDDDEDSDEGNEDGNEENEAPVTD